MRNSSSTIFQIYVCSCSSSSTLFLLQIMLCSSSSSSILPLLQIVFGSSSSSSVIPLLQIVLCSSSSFESGFSSFVLFFFFLFFFFFKSVSTNVGNKSEEKILKHFFYKFSLKRDQMQLKLILLEVQEFNFLDSGVEEEGSIYVNYCKNFIDQSWPLKSWRQRMYVCAGTLESENGGRFLFGL